MLTGLPPLISSDTRLLILGSFPSTASLAAHQYYGHPQNQFWPVLQAIFPSCPISMVTNSYQIRSKWLLSKQLGVWDVYAACERKGSLDSHIRNPVVNDFAGLRRLCPALEAIAHNGAESFKHARHVSVALAGIESRAGSPPASSEPLGGSALHDVKGVGILFHRLPSTSPANASWSFERKLAAWREIFEKHGLV